MPGELLPCPFCGCEYHNIVNLHSSNDEHIIECKDCAGRVNGKTLLHAKKAWNRRANAAETVATAHNIRVMPLPSIEEVLSQSGNMHGVLSVNERDAVIRAYHIIAQQQHNT